MFGVSCVLLVRFEGYVVYVSLFGVGFKVCLVLVILCLD